VVVQRSGIEPHLFVVLGATGDLMQRKLLPALFQVSAHEMLRDRVALLGVARAPLTDESFRAKVHESLTAAGVAEDDRRRTWADESVHYQPLAKADRAGYAALAERVGAIEKEHGLTGNRIFYLAVPLDVVAEAVGHLGEAGLAKSAGFRRVVVEKPFGRDLASAQALNRSLHAVFDESEVFRIDHYLGKETVQNLLVFRFANTLFESLWNRDRIDSVEITVAEQLGVEERSGYYDSAGAVRDMVQNHLTQLLTLTAMEVPGSLDADLVRNEKVKVLKSVRPPAPEDIVLGQYGPGKVRGQDVKGYREEDGVASDSHTETYAAMKLTIANWRWMGVPFLLRTGKRLPAKSTRIVVNFRRPPVTIFPEEPDDLRPNTLTITVQPDEGFDLTFEVKRPGHGFVMQTHRMRFRYAEAFGPLADAYQTLLTDLMRGDPTLFVRADEVEAAWEIYSPLIEHWPAVHPYPAGSAGPAEAARLVDGTGTHWSTDG
jgi:glucose-6-phosphate 1-dehydrogenase